MVRQETPNEDFGQTGGFTFPDVEAIFESAIDASFATGPARTITLHLDPILSAASGTMVTNKAFRYDPFNKEAFRPAPVERSPGVHKEKRKVAYKAHIKHGPTDIDDESTPLGRIFQNEVQITTDSGSTSDILGALYAEIDGSLYKLSRGPRPIGWGTVKYLISVWTEADDVLDGAS